MVEQEHEHEIDIAFDEGIKIFNEYDVDVEDIMTILKRHGYFNASDLDLQVEKSVRKLLEGLFVKNGYNPYFER